MVIVMEPNKELSIKSFNNYLGSLLPANETTEGRWGYNDKKVTFSNNPLNQTSDKIEAVLTQIDKDLEAYCYNIETKWNNVDREQMEICQKRLNSLKQLVETKVERYHHQHSGFFSSISVFFNRILYGDVDTISQDVLAKIDTINTIKEATASSDRWIARAQKFGFSGSDGEEPKTYIKSLEDAVSYFVPQSSNKFSDPDLKLQKKLEDFKAISDDKKLELFQECLKDPSLYDGNLKHEQSYQHSMRLLQYLMTTNETFQTPFSNRYEFAWSDIKINKKRKENKFHKLIEDKIRKGGNPSILIKVIQACNFNNEAGHKLLTTALQHGSVDVAKALIEASAFSEQTMNEAIKAGQSEIIRFLIQNKKVDLNHCQNEKYRPTSPLGLALEYGNINNIAELLLRMGADVNAATHDGSPFFVAAKRGLADIAKQISEKTTDKNHCGPGGSPTLQPQIQSYETLKILLANGADVNAKDRFGHTALDRLLEIMIKKASRKVIGHEIDELNEEKIKLLLSYGANITVALKLASQQNSILGLAKRIESWAKAHKSQDNRERPIPNNDWTNFLDLIIKDGKLERVDKANLSEYERFKNDVIDRKTPRELFGLGFEFTAAELKKAYVKLSLKIHPDKANNKNEANQLFAVCNRVYNMLQKQINK